MTSQYNKLSLNTFIEAIPPSDAASINLFNEKNVEEILNASDSIFYGKALYPRYYKINETLPDDRKGTIPDPDKNRIDFYLIGTQNSWISFPVAFPDNFIPHFSDVLILGKKTRNSEFDQKQGFLPYIQADTIFLLQ